MAFSLDAFMRGFSGTRAQLSDLESAEVARGGQRLANASSAFNLSQAQAAAPWTQRATQYAAMEAERAFKFNTKADPLNLKKLERELELKAQDVRLNNLMMPTYAAQAAAQESQYKNEAFSSGATQAQTPDELNAYLAATGKTYRVKPGAEPGMVRLIGPDGKDINGSDQPFNEVWMSIVDPKTYMGMYSAMQVAGVRGGGGEQYNIAGIPEMFTPPQPAAPTPAATPGAATLDPSRLPPGVLQQVQQAQRVQQAGYPAAPPGPFGAPSQAAPRQSSMPAPPPGPYNTSSDYMTLLRQSAYTGGR